MIICWRTLGTLSLLYDFGRFSEAHEFEKPNDAKALNLMNSCALSVLEEYPDIVFSYGFSDEFSFVFKRTTKFYQRRARYCWEIAIFYSLNFLVLDCCMLLLRCRLVIRKHFHSFHFSEVRFDVSLVKGENSDLAAKYCPSLYLSSLLFIPQNGKNSFLRWSWSILLHFTQESYAVHQWRFFKHILHGGKMIVSFKASKLSRSFFISVIWVLCSI